MTDAPLPPAPAPIASPGGATTTVTVDEPVAPSSPPERRHASPLRGAVEWVVILAVALIGAFVIRTFLIQAFYIPSDSMLPTLQKHDRVLVNKLSYDLHPVHRGDIVVFTHSPGFDPTIKDLIKRVIGLPGESVAGHDGHVYINGHQLTEPYLPTNTLTSDFPSRVVPPGRYWVMGDNRTNSTDSRVFGPITKSQLVGRAFVLVWPLGRLHLL
jgi:signal peptidase I